MRLMFVWSSSSSTIPEVRSSTFSDVFLMFFKRSDTACLEFTSKKLSDSLNSLAEASVYAFSKASSASGVVLRSSATSSFEIVIFVFDDAFVSIPITDDNKSIFVLRFFGLCKFLIVENVAAHLKMFLVKFAKWRYIYAPIFF